MISNGAGIMVTQLENGKKIRTFDSITEAARMTKTPAAKITECCKGLRGPVKGYLWQYADIDKRNDISNFMINLEQLMTEKGYDYFKLQKEICVSEGTLQKFHSLSVDRALDILVRIAKELHVTTDKLLGVNAKKIEILKCPFCGNANLYCYDTGEYMDEQKNRTSFVIRCDVCGAKGPVKPNKNEAAEAWNEVASLVNHDNKE